MTTPERDQSSPLIGTRFELIERLTHEMCRDLARGRPGSSRFVLVADPTDSGTATIVGRVGDPHPVHLPLTSNLAFELLLAWPWSATEGRRRVGARHAVQIVGGEGEAREAVAIARGRDARRREGERRVRALVDAAQQAFGSPRLARVWLEGWHPPFGDTSRAEYARQSDQMLALELTHLEEDARQLANSRAEMEERASVA